MIFFSGLHTVFKQIIYILVISIIISNNDAKADESNDGTRLTTGIVTRTNVEMYADLALDVRDIRELIRLEKIEEALDVYVNGRNALKSSSTTTIPLYKRKFTLHELSRSLASKPSTRTPMYMFHLYGFSDRSIDNKLENQAFYADNFVRTRITRSSTESHTAGDAIVALHLWMYGTHLLYNGMNTCRLLSDGSLPDLVSKLNGGGMDEFIALWIGSDQNPGTSNGHSLYAMTEQAQTLFTPPKLNNFNVGITLPEAITNTNIKMLYHKGTAALSFSDACSTEDDNNTVNVLWSVTQQIVSAMYVPLMQLLLDALYRMDSESIQLYSMALIPQLSQCRPSVYKRLKQTLLDGGNLNANRLSQIITDLQSVYDCLGFSCQDIGTYKGKSDSTNANNVPLFCEDSPENQALVEYHPKRKVHWKAMIDLDILQMNILTSLKMYRWSELLYLYGRNVIEDRDTTTYSAKRDVISLHSLAIDSNRKTADPYYSDFVKYHNKPNYADEVILQTLRKQGSWGETASSQQATAIVTNTASFQILYMTILTALAKSIQQCFAQKLGEEDVDDLLYWDEAAALLIGSLEGPSSAGSFDLEDGQLFWNLANKRANQFHTNNDSGYSLINEELEDLLFAGRAEAMSFDCENLGRSADRIRHLIMLPLMQSTIRYAVLNQGLTSSSTSANLALGEVYSLAVLPLIAKYDDNAAQLIRENMVIRDGAPIVPDGPQQVSNAFYQVLEYFGYSCALVGFTIQADACKLAGGFSQVRPEFDDARNENAMDKGSGTIALSPSIVSILAAITSLAVIVVQN